jgi:hypothetical protein
LQSLKSLLVCHFVVQFQLGLFGKPGQKAPSLTIKNNNRTALRCLYFSVG